MNQAFSDYAPFSWSAGPLDSHLEALESPAIRAAGAREWIQLASGEFAISMGPANGLVAVATRFSGSRAHRVLDRRLPPFSFNFADETIAVFRWNGQQTGRIVDTDGSTICTILAEGTYVVYPPVLQLDGFSTPEDNLYDIALFAHPLPADFEDELITALREPVDFAKQPL